MKLEKEKKPLVKEKHCMKIPMIQAALFLKVFLLIGQFFVPFNLLEAGSLVFEEDESRIIVRTWFSKPYSINVNGELERPESVGHVALEVSTSSSYLSMWPDDTCLVANPLEQPIRARFSQTYEEDIIFMGRPADSVVCLYSLPVKFVVEAISSLRKTPKWYLLAQTHQHLTSESHNCATAVFEVISCAVNEQKKVRTLVEFSEDEESIFSSNETLFPSKERRSFLARVNKSLRNDGWERSVARGTVLFPTPEINVIGKKPCIVSPCSLDLWVKNYRRIERSESLRVGIIAPYADRRGVKEEGNEFYSWYNPASLLRAYNPDCNVHLMRIPLQCAVFFLVDWAVTGKKFHIKTNENDWRWLWLGGHAFLFLKKASDSKLYV